ncbi:hypothetical protein GCM10027578_40980 [Spirosoma luteolum]
MGEGIHKVKARGQWFGADVTEQRHHAHLASVDLTDACREQTQNKEYKPNQFGRAGKAGKGQRRGIDGKSGQQDE